MEGFIVPECYFDTVLVKTILNIEGPLNHKKGCNNVVKAMSDGKLKDSFAVGIVDKDKKELHYLKDFICYEFENLNLHKHKSKPQFVIQLNPPIEKWIIKVAEEAAIDLTKFGLPMDVERLKKVTKSELAEESKELKHLCRALISSESFTIKRLANWITYLSDKKYNTDINYLINA